MARKSSVRSSSVRGVTPKRVVVTGAAGKLGTAVCKAFLKAGWDVVGVMMHGTKKPAPLAKVKFYECDLSDGSHKNLNKLAEVFDGRTVVHLVGIVDFRAKKSLLHAVNVACTRHALVAAHRAKSPRFVFCSSTSVHRIPKYLPIDEKHPNTPMNYYGESKIEAEALVKHSGVPYVIIRPTVLYGPSFTMAFEKFFKMARAGKLTVIGSGANRMGFVYEDDAAKAFVLAASAQGALGREFIIASDEKVTQKQALEAFAKAVGGKPPARHVPKQLAYLMAALEGVKARITGKPAKVTAEEVHTFCEDRYYDISKAREYLGWKPVTKFPAGLKKMAAALKA